MIKRRLTVSFKKSVGTTATMNPEVVEVVVIPITAPSSNLDNYTLVGGKQVQKISLTQSTNNAYFDLVPTDDPGLSERILYRIGWRTQFLGKTYTEDFAMPNFDVNFADLHDLGEIVPSETYLQQADLGVAGRVAKLNEDGQVVNAFGTPITGQGDADAVGEALASETAARLAADNAVRIQLEQELAAQIQSTLDTAQSNLLTAVSNLHTADLSEATIRANAVIDLNNTIDQLETDTNAQIADLVATTESHTATLLTKADLVGGKVPSSQLPTISLTTAVPVADQAAMLALTTTQVQPGDLAVRPDGTWILLQNPPSTLSNWLKTSSAGEVLSVNGHTGAVVLAASDVGARSSSVAVPATDVTGLADFETATNSSLTSQASRITAIENSTVIVRLNGSGVVQSTLLDTDIARVNNSNVLVKKDGTPIAVTGSGAVDSVNGKTGIVTLAIADLADLQNELDDRVLLTDPRLTDSRNPTSHKNTHFTGGSDELTPAQIGARSASDPVPIGDVQNLSTTLTNHGNRINALEVGGVSGGGSGTDLKGVRYDWYEATDDFSNVAIDSPFGYNPTNPNANADGFYYNPDGADDGEGVYAYITPNGHLELRRRNEANGADPELATQGDLDSLTTIVGGKASQTDLDDLTTVVGGKAEQTDLDDLTTVVGGKASQTAVDDLTTVVGGKASQTDLDDLVTVVGGKALQTDVDDLTTVVAGKADQTDLDDAVDRLDTIETALPNKADLSGGVLTSSQVPTNIPESSIMGLVSDLAAKADLVGGKIPSSQLPSIATSETYTVASRAAMLALTTTQVQVGDICIITTGADVGTYQLIDPDPTSFSNWLKYTQAADSVTSVNGHTGIVVLAASDVGARSSSVAVPQADVSGLVTALSLKANLTDLVTKTSTSDVNGLITASVVCKQLAGRVATSNIASLSGQQVADGSLMSLGTVVLLTAQTSSIQNGLWTVNTGAWTRVSDMSDASYFVKGTLVLVSGGTVNSNTFWQETAASGVVGTNVNNWSKVMTAGPPNAYTGSNGVLLSGLDFSLKAVTGGGIVASAGGASVDTNVVVRKYAVNCPSGSTVANITHNLGTLDVEVTVREIGSGLLVFVPITVTGLNTCSLEFGTAPTSGQYRVIVQG